MSQTALRTAVFLSLAGYSFYAFGDAIAKHLTMSGYSSFQTPILYCLVSIVFLFIFSRKLGGAKSAVHTSNKKLHLIRALLFAPSQALNFYAFSKLPMANAYTILFMMPFITTIIAHFYLKEKTPLLTWACILLGFTGVIIVNRPDLAHIEWPMMAVMCSAFLSASRNIVARKMGYEETAFSLTLFPCISIICACIIPAVTMGKIIDVQDIPWFILGGLCFAAGTICVSVSFLQKVDLSLLTPFHYSQIIWGILFGIFIFSNTPDAYTWIGSFLVIISGITLVYSQKRRIKKAEAIEA